MRIIQKSDKQLNDIKYRSFLNLWRKPLSLSVNCWRGGVPIEGEQEGKASPLEAGRGKYSPPVSPERVTSKALKRRDKGFR